MAGELVDRLAGLQLVDRSPGRRRSEVAAARGRMTRPLGQVAPGTHEGQGGRPPACA